MSLQHYQADTVCNTMLTSVVYWQPICNSDRWDLTLGLTVLCPPTRLRFLFKWSPRGVAIAIGWVGFIPSGATVFVKACVPPTQFYGFFCFAVPRHLSEGQCLACYHSICWEWVTPCTRRRNWPVVEPPHVGSDSRPDMGVFSVPLPPLQPSDFVILQGASLTIK